LLGEDVRVGAGTRACGRSSVDRLAVDGDVDCGDDDPDTDGE
jgi:hypothetical protein